MYMQLPSVQVQEMKKLTHILDSSHFHEQNCNLNMGISVIKNPICLMLMNSVSEIFYALKIDQFYLYRVHICALRGEGSFPGDIFASLTFTISQQESMQTKRIYHGNLSFSLYFATNGKTPGTIGDQRRFTQVTFTWILSGCFFLLAIRFLPCDIFTRTLSGNKKINEQ